MFYFVRLYGELPPDKRVFGEKPVTVQIASCVLPDLFYFICKDLAVLV